MRFSCPKCNSVVEEDVYRQSRFCLKCGTFLKAIFETAPNNLGRIRPRRRLYPVVSSRKLGTDTWLQSVDRAYKEGRKKKQGR